MKLDWKLALACAWALLGTFAQAAAPVAPLPAEIRPKQEKTDASDAFFNGGHIPQLKIEVAPPEVQKLRENARAYVKATLIEDGKTEYKEVGVKLKGAAGSFRNFDDRPALTINMNKYVKGQSFHELDKFALNNSAQDDTLMNEFISYEVCKAAGVPATRVSHARVWLNGRDLGLYVLKEGFDKQFLKRHFASSKGNLYDGGFCQEINGNLEKDSGEGVDDRSDLKAIVDACNDGDQAKRWQRVEELVDIDAFFTFTAIELMMGHWDGYGRNRNNYRIYFEPKSKKAYFMPHGMDQLFGDANYPVIDGGALLTQVVLQNPEWRARYRERVKNLVSIFSPPDKILARVDEVSARLKPVLAAMNPQLPEQYEGRVRGVKERFTNRARGLEAQKVTREAIALNFNEQGEAKVPDWFPTTEQGNAMQSEVDVPNRGKAYTIACQPNSPCVASWRRSVILPKGNYVLKVTADAKDVVPAETDKPSAIGVRISGGQRTNKLEGSGENQTLEFPFEITDTQKEVVLVAELRAKQGQAWFLTDSFRIVRK